MSKSGNKISILGLCAIVWFGLTSSIDPYNICNLYYKSRNDLGLQGNVRIMQVTSYSYRGDSSHAKILNKSRYTFTPSGRLMESVSSTGLGRIQHNITYNSDNKLVQITALCYRHSESYLYQYDSLNRVSHIWKPDSQLFKKYTYTLHSNASHKITKEETFNEKGEVYKTHTQRFRKFMLISEKVMYGDSLDRYDTIIYDIFDKKIMEEGFYHSQTPRFRGKLFSKKTFHYFGNTHQFKKEKLYKKNKRGRYRLVHTEKLNKTQTLTTLWSKSVSTSNGEYQAKIKYTTHSDTLMTLETKQARTKAGLLFKKYHKRNYIYEFDSQGNWVTESFYSSKGVLLEQTHRHIEYY